MDLVELTPEALADFVTKELEEPEFRARQIYRWIHQRGATDFDQMTDLSKALREKLAARGALIPLVKDLEQRSKDGTIKYRFATRDGHRIEAVYMPSEDRKTLCVSTQVGCAMGCKFCMTATLGFTRNLSAGEIVTQVYLVNAEILRNENISDTRRPLTNLVFMGMGEPLHNFENVKTALKILTSEDGANFSHRHITVSTVGLVPQLERFGQEIDAKLAVSLNATNDATRSELMPVNKRWGITEVLKACRQLPLRQGRRITFEYVLMAGVNDSDDDAFRLVRLLAGIPAKINLIQYNENPTLGFQRSSDSRAESFREILARGHLPAFIRINRGNDIAGACGQLGSTDGCVDCHQ